MNCRFRLRSQSSKQLVGCLRTGLGQVLEAISATHREIGLLREYRTRLIADVVTGKLDAREAAARLPDEVEELEQLDETDALIDGEEEAHRRPRHRPLGGCGVTTDTSERGLERLICTALAGHACDPPQAGQVSEPHAGLRRRGLERWQFARLRPRVLRRSGPARGIPEVHPAGRRRIVGAGRGRPGRGASSWPGCRARSPSAAPSTCCATASDTARTTWICSTARRRPGTCRRRNASNRTASPSSGSFATAATDTQRALDIGLFINGLPVFTFELKNSLTKQTVDDAVWQYQKDRNPREKLFESAAAWPTSRWTRADVRFCTHLKGKASWFLPFNRGWNDGAGNPPNPRGIKTDYLWREVLTRESLTDILENYAQVVEAKDEKTGKKQRTQIWPRYQQLDVVRRLLADPATRGTGRRYLIQHSAGSGKSQLHRLAGPPTDRAREGRRPDLRLDHHVVTDRRILDRQIRDTIKQYAQVGATVGHAERSGDLRRFIEAGKKIIISTVQKFPFILDEIGNEQRGQRFAIIIDEAHSSQGGRTSASISAALGTAGEEAEEETPEDHINRLMESRRLLPNASYFAFTATPKNKTLEIFGEPDPQPGGRGQAPRLPQLHHEAGNPGGVHPGRAGALHAGGQLLPDCQDGGGRPGVRRQEGAEEAAALRRGPRARDPPQGRDHGRPLP